MAWITGLVSDAELRKLRAIGWKDEDFPREILSEDAPHESVETIRAFFVDSDVFEIMTGPDWEQPRPDSGDEMADDMGETQCGHGCRNPSHTKGAIRAAEILTGGEYGDRKKYPTGFGDKTVEGIADLIDRATRPAELIRTADAAVGVLRYSVIPVLEDRQLNAAQKVEKLKCLNLRDLEVRLVAAIAETDRRKED